MSRSNSSSIKYRHYFVCKLTFFFFCFYDCYSPTITKILSKNFRIFSFGFGFSFVSWLALAIICAEIKILFILLHKQQAIEPSVNTPLVLLCRCVALLSLQFCWNILQVIVPGFSLHLPYFIHLLLSSLNIFFLFFFFLLFSNIL